MKHLLAMATLTLALGTVATPAAAKDDQGRGHGNRDRGHQVDRRADRRGESERWDRGNDHRRGDDRDDRRWAGDRHGGNHRDYDRHRHYDRHRYYYRPAPRVVYHPAPRYYRGAPPWARGHDYRSYGYGNVYYVPYNDYGRYRLYRPHHGHRWVRDDHGNFLLVAAATGIITSILLNHAY